MKRYVGVHLNTSTLRAAIMKGGKPTIVPARDGGLAYSTQGVLSQFGGGWMCNMPRLEQLFQQVHADVERFAGAGEWEMVLVVPAALGAGFERNTIRPTAQKAGFPVAYIMKECAAVALNYFWNGMGRGEDEFQIAVAMATDLTAAASVLEISDDIAEECAMVSEKGAITPDVVAAKMHQVMTEAGEPAQSGTGRSQVRALLLNNEAVRKPGYREMLTALKRPGQKIYGYPDETVALGAALQAGKLAGDPQVREPLLLSVLAHDYYVVTADGRNVQLLSRNMTVPVKKATVFHTAEDQQTTALIRVVEADEEHIESPDKVFQMELKGITPRAAKEGRIEVSLEVDAGGNIRGFARELSGTESASAASIRVGALPAVGSQSVTQEPKTAAQESGKGTAKAPAKESVKALEKPAPQEAVVSLAEFENFRRRMTQEKDAMYDRGIRKALEQFLPVVDSFERGLTMLSPEQKNTEAAAGMERIYRQMLKAMEELGVKPIEAVGKPFDLNLHNAVMQAEIPGVGENIIVEEFQKGYLYHDTVLRYSTVKVNK